MSLNRWIVPLAVIGVPALAAQDAARPLRVSSATMRAACEFATARRYGDAPARSQARTLDDWCQLPPPLSLDAARKWQDASIPSIGSVDSAAAGIELSMVVPPDLPDIPIKGRPVGALPLSGGFGTGFLPSQGIILTGLAQHAVGRAKEIVSIYVVKEFADRICTQRVLVRFRPRADTVTVMAAGFVPGTCAMLRAGGQEMMGPKYGLPSWGVLQASMRRDLDALPDTVFAHLRNFGAKGLADSSGMTDPALRAARERLVVTLSAARFAQSYVRRRDLPAAFADATAEIAAALHAVCRATSPATASDTLATCAVPWNDMPTARNLMAAASLLALPPSAGLDDLDDPRAREATLTLVLRTLLVNLRPNDPNADEMLRGAWTSLATALKLSGPMTSRLPLDVRKAWTVVSVTSDSLRQTQRALEDDLESAGADREQRLRAYLRAAAAATPLLVTALDSIAPNMVRAEVSALVQRLGALAQLRADGKYAELLATLLALPDDIAGVADARPFRVIVFPPFAMRIMQFAQDASQAPDADAFQAVLESYAAPADGFLRKRTRIEQTSLVYWSVNSYVGASYGREVALDRALPNGRVEARYHGLWLPVGLEVGRKTPGGAFAAFLQVADLGQVASWRSKQGDTTVKTTPPSLTFASVFAPGVNVTWNMPRLPLALGVGVARAPQFRDVEPAVGEPRKATVWRRIVFLGVDVPLIP